MQSIEHIVVVMYRIALVRWEQLVALISFTHSKTVRIKVVHVYRKVCVFGNGGQPV